MNQYVVTINIYHTDGGVGAGAVKESVSVYVDAETPCQAQINVLYDNPYGHIVERPVPHAIIGGFEYEAKCVDTPAYFMRTHGIKLVKLVDAYY